MKISSVLDAWSKAKTCGKAATSKEVDEASSLLSFYEDALGPGKTKDAMLLARADALERERATEPTSRP